MRDHRHRNPRPTAAPIGDSQAMTVASTCYAVCRPNRSASTRIADPARWVGMSMTAVSVYRSLRACSDDGLVPPCAADSPVTGATGCICELVGCGGQIKLGLFHCADPECELHAPGPPTAKVVTVHPIRTAGTLGWHLPWGSRSFPGRLRFGQGNGAAPAGPGPACHNPNRTWAWS